MCSVCSHVFVFGLSVTDACVRVSAGHVDCSGIVSSAADVLWMRGVVGVCEMCKCLARGGVGGEVVSG